MTLSSPKLCIPTDPENSINLVLQKKKKNIEQINKIKKDIIKKVNCIVFTSFVTSIPTFRVIQGLENVYSSISLALEIAKGIVYITTPIKDIMIMYHSDIPEKIKLCKKNGGRVFLITDSDEKLVIPYIKRINATENKIGKLPSNGRITVFENMQMLMSDSTNTFDFMGENSDISLCADAPEMTNNIFSLCKFLWDVAISLNPKKN